MKQILIWAVWDAVGGTGLELDRPVNFAKPVMRQKPVEIILEAKALDVEAAGYLEKALAGTSPE